VPRVNLQHPLLLQPGRQHIFGNGLREQGAEAEVISVLLPGREIARLVRCLVSSDLRVPRVSASL